MKHIIAASMLALCTASPGFAHNFISGITGHDVEGLERPTVLLSRPAVQKALLAVVEEARSSDEVAQMIDGEPFGVQALIKTRLLREDGDQLYLAFNFAGEADRDIFEHIRAEQGRRLAEAELEQRGRIEAALAGYDLETVPRDVLAYILVGVFSLDWDGLDYTAERGWRSRGPERPGGEFHVWALPIPRDGQLRTLFNGSQNESLDGATLTSFGDYHTMPRMAFPDLAWRMEAKLRGIHPDFADAVQPAAAADSVRVMNNVDSIMLALRDGPQPVGSLVNAAGEGAARVGRILTALEAIGYVERDGEVWVATIPVLDGRDTGMTRAVLMAGRDAIAAWGEANRGDVFEDMQHLTAVRQGVPAEEMFDSLWHFIFGEAVASLVEEGFLADPYAKREGLRGFFPVVWTKFQSAPC